MEFLKHKWNETIYVEVRPNTTTGVEFNGQMIGKVTLEVMYTAYSQYTTVYTFSRPPPLSIHRNMSVFKEEERGPLYFDNFVSDKFNLNNRSRMDVSFCGDGEMEVLVLETDVFLHNLNYPSILKTVRWRKTFNGTDCQFDNETSNEFSFTTNASSTYQFVYRPWHSLHLPLVLSNVMYRGDLTQYDLKGNKSYCRPSSDSFICSVALPKTHRAMVVIDSGNVDLSQGVEFTTSSLKTTLRSSKITVVSVATFSSAAVFCFIVVIVACWWHKRFRGDSSEELAGLLP